MASCFNLATNLINDGWIVLLRESLCRDRIQQVK